VHAVKRFTLRCRLKGCTMKAQQKNVDSGGKGKLSYRPGACVQCSSAKCYEAMHPLCVLEPSSGCAHRLVTTDEGSRIQVFCPNHAHEAKDGKKTLKLHEMMPTPDDEEFSPVTVKNGINQVKHNLISDIPESSITATATTTTAPVDKSTTRNATKSMTKSADTESPIATTTEKRESSTKSSSTISSANKGSSSKNIDNDNSNSSNNTEAVDNLDIGIPDVISSLLQLSEAATTDDFSSQSEPTVAPLQNHYLYKPRRGRPPKNGYSLDGQPVYRKQSREAILSCPFDAETCTDSPLYVIEEYDIIHRNILSRYINIHAMAQCMGITTSMATSLINKAHKAQYGPAYRWTQKTQREIVHDELMLYEQYEEMKLPRREVYANTNAMNGNSTTTKRSRGRPRKVFSEMQKNNSLEERDKNPYSKNYYTTSGSSSRNSSNSNKLSTAAYTNEIQILDTVEISTFGLGKVIDIRCDTDGMYEVESLTWKLANLKAPVFYVPKTAITLIEKSKNGSNNESVQLSDRAIRSFARGLLPTTNFPPRYSVKHKPAILESRVGAIKYQAKIPDLVTDMDKLNYLRQQEPLLQVMPVWRSMNTDDETVAKEILRRLRKRNLLIYLRKGMILPVYRGRGTSLLCCVIQVNSEIVKVFDGSFTFDVNIRHCEMASKLYEEIAHEAIYKLGMDEASANLDKLHVTILQLHAELYGHRRVPQELGAIVNDGCWSGTETAIFCDAYTRYGENLKKIHSYLANSRYFSEVVDFFTSHEPRLGDPTYLKTIKAVYAMRDRILKPVAMAQQLSSSKEILVVKPHNPPGVSVSMA